MRCTGTLIERAIVAAMVVLAGARGAAAADGVSSGRVEFDHTGGPAPNVEVDLPAEMFRDVLGLGDAVIAGVAQGLVNTAGSGAADGEVKMAADQLAEIRQLVGILQGAVQEVRVRVYQGQGNETPGGGAVAQHYADKLKNSTWDRIVNVREEGQTVSVFVLRESGAFRGVFVVAAERNEMVLVNVVCDVSPERVQQVASQAVSMGIKFGGDQALRQLLQQIRGHQQQHAH